MPEYLHHHHHHIGYVCARLLSLSLSSFEYLHVRACMGHCVHILRWMVSWWFSRSHSIRNMVYGFFRLTYITYSQNGFFFSHWTFNHFGFYIHFFPLRLVRFHFRVIVCSIVQYLGMNPIESFFFGFLLISTTYIYTWIKNWPIFSILSAFINIQFGSRTRNQSNSNPVRTIVVK